MTDFVNAKLQGLMMDEQFALIYLLEITVSCRLIFAREVSVIEKKH